MDRTCLLTQERGKERPSWRQPRSWSRWQHALPLTQSGRCWACCLLRTAGELSHGSLPFLSTLQQVTCSDKNAPLGRNSLPFVQTRPLNSRCTKNLRRGSHGVGRRGLCLTWTAKSPVPPREFLSLAPLVPTQHPVPWLPARGRHPRLPPARSQPQSPSLLASCPDKPAGVCARSPVGPDTRLHPPNSGPLSCPRELSWWQL